MAEWRRDAARRVRLAILERYAGSPDALAQALSIAKRELAVNSRLVLDRAAALVDVVAASPGRSLSANVTRVLPAARRIAARSRARRAKQLPLMELGT